MTSTSASPSASAATDRRLRGFTGAGYDKGRGLLTQAAWFAVLNLVFMKWWCPPRLRPRCCGPSAPASANGC